MVARKPSRKPGTTRKNSTSSTRKTSKPPVKKTVTRKTSSQPKTPTTFAGMIAEKKRSLAGTHVFVLNVPYEAQFLARSLKTEYHKGLKVHFYEGLKLPLQLQPYQSEDYSFERWVEDEVNGKPKPLTGVSRSMKPRPHQVQAIRKIKAAANAGWRGFILADAVGLGKTVTAVYGAQVAATEKGFTKDNPAKMLIVAPKSVLPHWRNTLKATGIPNVRAVVINYDQSKKLLDIPASATTVKKTVTANRHTMTKGKPNIRWDIVIADESQKLKNDSQRTAAFNNIARYSEVFKTAPFIIWASATIGQTPLELGYLAPLVAQMTGLKSLSVSQWGDWLIANRYHVKKSKAGNFSWVKNKPDMTVQEKKFVSTQQKKDISRISELLFNANAPSVRRIPENINGWPTQTYAPTPLVLDSAGQRLYTEAWTEFRKYIGLHPRGKNPAGGLAATMRFRQKASMLSATATAEFVNDLLDNGVQVALSVEFMETLDIIRTHLEKKGWHCAEFTGRNTDVREQERVRFQKGDANVILFSVLEGINLHAGEQLSDGTQATSTKRAMVVHDIRYSAIDMTQIIGRTTRDGQLALAYLMYTENTIEPQILQVVLERMKNVKTISGDDEETLIAVQNVLDTL